MSTVAPAISAFGPSTAIRRRRLAVSGPLGVTVGLSAAPRGPSKPARVYSRVPPESETVPANAVFSAALTPRDSPRLHPYLKQTIRHRRSVGNVAPSCASRPRLHRP